MAPLHDARSGAHTNCCNDDSVRCQSMIEEFGAANDNLPHRSEEARELLENMEDLIRRVGHFIKEKTPEFVARNRPIGIQDDSVEAWGELRPARDAAIRAREEVNLNRVPKSWTARHWGDTPPDEKVLSEAMRAHKKLGKAFEEAVQHFGSAES